MTEFNRMTIVAAAEVISGFKSHDDMAVLEVQFGISERCVSTSKSARVASWAKIAVDESLEVMTEGGRMSLARAMVEVAIQAPQKAQGSNAWRKFIAGLRFDGFERVERSEDTAAEHPWQRSAARVTVELRRMLPDDVPGLDFHEAESEVFHLLKVYGFTVALGHIEQAISAFQRGEWASANAQMRTFYQALLDRIAVQLGCNESQTDDAKREYLASTASGPFFLTEYNEWVNDRGRPAYVLGLWARLHTQGNHPGLSEEDDATFRLQITLITARLFMRRYHKRISGLAA